MALPTHVDRRCRGRRVRAVIISLSGLALLATGLGLAGSVTHADAQSPPLSLTPSTCFVVDEIHDGDLTNPLIQINIAADGSFTFTDLGAIDNGLGVDTVNVESVASRNGFDPHPLYTFDPSSRSLIRISTSSGADSIHVANADLGDIDGLTWRFDNDHIAGNDELWGIVRLAGAPDQLVQIHPETAELLHGPIDIKTRGSDQENNVDSITWDAATNLFYATTNLSLIHI